MSAVVGGSGACFVLRVLETHQYLYFFERGEALGLLCYSSWGWVVSRREDFPQSRQFFALCAWRKKGVGGRKCGAPPKFEVVWAGLNARSPGRSAKFLTPGCGGTNGTYL